MEIKVMKKADGEYVALFKEKIKNKYLPEVERLNKQVEQIFRSYNQIAYENIQNIFSLIQSEEFVGLVNNTEPIALYFGGICPLFNKADMLKKEIESFNQLPLARYYWGCLSLYYQSNIEIKAGKGYIEIGEEKFTSAVKLYDSVYRLFFYDYSIIQLKDSVKKYLRKIGAIHD